ncbi:MAG: excinuclease ABC subunit UvrA [Saprospiraceae bacterium]|nr:excinuclease ABC subunit UvrA [Saprospiraceae bacterium]
MPGAKRKAAEDVQHAIYIKGARSNNLKNIDVVIPKNKMVVVTGLSGSGKSSLVMDTLYSEGQRRYVESLSSYARQFLNRMKKPEVDYIKGICPAIAIEQKVSTRNARSTVGSLTEIYDYLRLLYARVGRTISPVSGDEVRRHSVSDIVDAIYELAEGAKVRLLAPLHDHNDDRTIGKELEIMVQKGYTRIEYKGKTQRIEEFLESGRKELQASLASKEVSHFVLVIDRFAVHRADEDQRKRVADSVQTAIYESNGTCVVDVIDGETTTYNNKFELDGIEFIEPTPALFNYNNPYGACPRCEGFGRIMGIDPDKVIPVPSKSVYEGAVVCWNGEKSRRWLERFIRDAAAYDFPIHRPYHDLSKEEKKFLWAGAKGVKGIDAYFSELESKSYKIQNRVMLARYRGRTRCPECDGGRLRREAVYVKVGDKSLPELAEMPISELRQFVADLALTDYEAQIAERILIEVRSRLHTMCEVGLGYLTLERVSSTLSGGETQRINLTRLLGSNLTSSMYLLDEPSIGLHPRDTNRLVGVLEHLRDLGNTVIVVEHEEEIIKHTDVILDIGPRAGIHGGEVIYCGPYEAFLQNAADSLTQQYLTGQRSLPVPERRRPVTNKLLVKGARVHNLKGIDVTVPLQAMTVITGVSGSGKTSLVKHVLYPALRAHVGEIFSGPSAFGTLSGDLDLVGQVEFINQNPIGRSSRSNPITYVKAYDPIRKLFTDQQISKVRGYKPKHFSFNVEGGRCETCKGEGEIVVEMQFLADVKLICEDCKGKRFKREVLEVEYKGRNIYEVLDLSIEEAMQFFAGEDEIIRKIQPLYDVGLGYIKLGQSSSTLSGGEAQRVKLASFLGKESEENKVLFIFDEPTTGLHFHDIDKLLKALNALVELGHSVVVIEHNMDVIKSADWVVDLGPDAGEHGGALVCEGPPEKIAQCKASHTGQFLAEKLA